MPSHEVASNISGSPYDGVYLFAIGTFFNHADAFVNLTSLLLKAGRVSDAIGVLREAMSGVGTCTYRPPRHPIHFEPRFFEFIQF